MKWSEITVHTTTFGGELVADIFFEIGGNGVVIVDKSEILSFLSEKTNWDYYDDNIIEDIDEVVLVKGFVQQDIESNVKKLLHEKLELLKENADKDFDLGSLEIITREIESEDWANVWKKHFKPNKIKNVIICPEWIDYKKNNDSEVVVKIDPGMAFGTGEHETTGMCIELMQDVDLRDKNVLDVGCGSGILGASAIMLGAKKAYMVDFDPVAVKATNHNLQLNNILHKATIERGNLLDKNDLVGDVVFANITADVLLLLSKDITRFIKKDGVLIVSGLIHKRVDEVLNRYLECGFKLKRQVRNGEWNAISFTF